MLSENCAAHVVVLPVESVGPPWNGRFPILCYPKFVFATIQNSFHQMYVMPIKIPLLKTTIATLIFFT